MRSSFLRCRLRLDFRFFCRAAAGGGVVEGDCAAGGGVSSGLVAGGCSGCGFSAGCADAGGFGPEVSAGCVEVGFVGEESRRLQCRFKRLRLCFDRLGSCGALLLGQGGNTMCTATRR